VVFAGSIREVVILLLIIMFGSVTIVMRVIVCGALGFILIQIKVARTKASMDHWGTLIIVINQGRELLEDICGGNMLLEEHLAMFMVFMGVMVLGG